MKKSKVILMAILAGMLVFMSACSTAPTATNEAATSTSETVTETTTTEATSQQSTASQSLAFNNAAWQYDSDNDVYYQIGVQYVSNPATLDYETLGIYVPGAYVNATANGDGTFTISINNNGTINGYNAETAPMVFPVNTPGYSAQAAPTSYSYSEVSSYLAAGFIYVWAGMRGKANGYDSNGNLTYSGGAPWGVTDLKAAVRYIRYNAEVLPGDADRVFVFGMSGGGAQSSIIGASGDSALYTPYLEAIGAAMVDSNGKTLSDAVDGVMAWCPITSLDYADAAYEWNMGQFASTGTRASGTFTSALSIDLAKAYADYINKLGLKDENGNVLTLTETSDGVYLAGSYYDYLLNTIEQSLNNFLADTTFPYAQSSNSGAGQGGMPGGGTPPDGALPGGTPPDSANQTTATSSANSSTSTESSSTTYETAQDYIDSLNSDTDWVTYDATTNTATITSLEAFITHLKNASKDVPAFDDLNRGQAENDAFGNDQSDALHFDSIVANLLSENQSNYSTYSDWDSSLIEAYATDLSQLDSLGNSMQYRVNMYNPMYYLLEYYEGYQTSTVAKYWRINTGIDQGDTANTVEMNLALALESNSGVKNVAFTTVWGLGHTMAERTGDSTTNFIAWVNQVLSK